MGGQTVFLESNHDMSTDFPEITVRPKVMGQGSTSLCQSSDRRTRLVRAQIQARGVDSCKTATLKYVICRMNPAGSVHWRASRVGAWGLVWADR